MDPETIETKAALIIGNLILQLAKLEIEHKALQARLAALEMKTPETAP